MKSKQRHNIYYSSPYYYLYDGDDTGELICKGTDRDAIVREQKKLEEAHLDEKTD